ncbi:hypothetical protein JOM56_000490 [Amanita muscaria]
MGEVMDVAGRESMSVLNSIAKVLSVRGVQIKYIRNEDVERHAVQPLGEESPSDSVLDSVELAKRAAVDESLNPFSDPDSTWEPETTDETSEDLESVANLPLSANQVKDLYRFPLIEHRVTQQTGKGRVQYLVVVGNGDGLVGYGQAKGGDAPRALAKATALAIRSMDTVSRLEKRIIPTEMETKLGSTMIIMRPRLHQVLGIKDISAKVWGSRNLVNNVVKATFRMLWAGNAPLGMGDGVGGKRRKLDKGEGVRSRDRGSWLV